MKAAVQDGKESVLAQLREGFKQRGWIGGQGDGFAVREFATVEGRKEACAYVTFDGKDGAARIHGTFYSLGCNVLIDAVVSLPAAADHKAVRAGADAFVRAAMKAIAREYAQRVLRSMSLPAMACT